MDTTVPAGVVTQVGTTQRFPLGYTVEIPENGPGLTADRGSKKYRYIYNDSGADIAANKLVARKAGALTWRGLVAAAGTVYNKHRILGFTETAIPNGSYGFVVVKGFITGTAGSGAALSADTPVSSGGGTVAGTFLDAPNTADGAKAVIGMSGAGVAADGSVLLYLDVE